MDWDFVEMILVGMVLVEMVLVEMVLVGMVLEEMGFVGKVGNYLLGVDLEI